MPSTLLSPLIWAGIGVFGSVGLLAMISPTRFTALTRGSNRWIDTNRLLEKLDTQVDVDKYILPFSRQLGLVVVIAVGVLAFVFANYMAG